MFAAYYQDMGYMPYSGKTDKRGKRFPSPRFNPPRGISDVGQRRGEAEKERAAIAFGALFSEDRGNKPLITQA